MSQIFHDWHRTPILWLPKDWMTRGKIGDLHKRQLYKTPIFLTGKSVNGPKGSYIGLS